uniref:Pyroglutamyl-peptidase I n=1 Tax=Salix viminalis TaxID=40686 RepID=A0A6N2KWU4_SALVM
MGSEGPPAVTIHVTGFKKFHGVAENPTETIVGNLKEYMKKKGMPKGVILGSCSVLETAGQGAVAPLYQTFQSSIKSKDSESSSPGRIIWIHFGVNSGATRFAIEHQAVNEATFAVRVGMEATVFKFFCVLRVPLFWFAESTHHSFG